MNSVDPTAIRVVSFVKANERYMFLFRDTAADKAHVLRTIGRFASNPELAFSWYDASKLAKRIMEGA